MLKMLEILKPPPHQLPTHPSIQAHPRPSTTSAPPKAKPSQAIRIYSQSINHLLATGQSESLNRVALSATKQGKPLKSVALSATKQSKPLKRVVLSATRQGKSSMCVALSAIQSMISIGLSR
jgi:hypothetical protein